MRANCRLTSGASTSFERNACVQTLSTRMSASRRPSAEKTPGYSGTITFGMPSTRATRADSQEAARVDPGDRAAAGADRLDVDQRHRRRQAPLDLVFGRVSLRAVDEDPDVGARAAHVEREHVALAERAGDVLRRG